MSNLSPFGGGKNPPWVRNAGKVVLILIYVLLSIRVQVNNVAKFLLQLIQVNKFIKYFLLIFCAISSY